MKLFISLALALVFLLEPQSFAANQETSGSWQDQEIYLSRMQQQLQRLDTIRATQDPIERQRLLQELRQKMRELMDTMNNQQDVVQGRAGAVPGMTF